MPNPTDCLYCGTPFTPGDEPEEKSCCSGCQFVHQLLHQENLDRFYELKGDTSVSPVQNRPFRKLALQWLTDLQKSAEKNNTDEQRGTDRPASPTGTPSPSSVKRKPKSPAKPMPPSPPPPSATAPRAKTTSAPKASTPGGYVHRSPARASTGRAKNSSNPPGASQKSPTSSASNPNSPPLPEIKVR